MIQRMWDVNAAYDEKAEVISFTLANKSNEIANVSLISLDFDDDKKTGITAHYFTHSDALSTLFMWV